MHGCAPLDASKTLGLVSSLIINRQYYMVIRERG
jgi:hypothetical protein